MVSKISTLKDICMINPILEYSSTMSALLRMEESLLFIVNPTLAYNKVDLVCPSIKIKNKKRIKTYPHFHEKKGEENFATLSHQTHFSMYETLILKMQHTAM